MLSRGTDLEVRQEAVLFRRPRSMLQQGMAWVRMRGGRGRLLHHTGRLHGAPQGGTRYLALLRLVVRHHSDTNNGPTGDAWWHGRRAIDEFQGLEFYAL